ncbi:MAG: hypothetical protein EA357_04630 [Micavibrio sp.]|nr:MAG: hypothetical protein EA357_04630 [Micavibrio sp.]
MVGSDKNSVAVLVNSETKARTKYYLLIAYVAIFSVITGVYYGYMTVDGFLSGTPEQVGHDLGGIFGTIVIPWIVSLPIALVVALYNHIKKKPKLFWISWLYTTTVTATIIYFELIKSIHYLEGRGLL